MATFRPGPLVSAISGNLGGVNFVQGKYGPYMRKRLYRVHKTTPLQLERRARFSLVTRVWAEIDPWKRDEWNAIANTMQQTHLPEGPRYTSGFELFVQQNMDRQEDTWVQDIVPKYAARQPPLTGLTLTAAVAGAIDASWDVPVNYRLAWWYFYGSRSLSLRPKVHFKNYRYLGREWVVGVHGDAHLRIPWDLKIGPPFQGERIGIRVKGGGADSFFCFHLFAQTTTAP